MTSHARPPSKWKLHATTAAWFLGLTLFAYYTIGANPFGAGIAALLAAAAIGIRIYLLDRRRP